MLRSLFGRKRVPADAEQSPLFLVIGLGNPGRDYAEHRHNVGFMTVSELARRHSIPLSRRQKRSLVGTGEIAGRRILLAQPQTGMNDSGKSVGALRSFYHVPPERSLLIFDDLDLPLGRVRMRARGSAGGHHGLESTIAETGTMDYPRVRIGIGRPATREEVINFVLAPFHRDEREEAEEAVARAADAVEAWLAGGIEAAMNQVNVGGAASSARKAPPAEDAAAQ